RGWGRADGEREKGEREKGEREGREREKGEREGREGEKGEREGREREKGGREGREREKGKKGEQRRGVRYSNVTKLVCTTKLLLNLKLSDFLEALQVDRVTSYKSFIVRCTE